MEEERTPDGIDPLAKALGWLSLAAGMMKLLESRRSSQAAGPGNPDMIRIYGPGDMADMPTLSVARPAGPKGRVVGDLLEIATLLPALRARNPQRGKALVALAAVTGVTLFDLLAWRAATRRGRLR